MKKGIVAIGVVLAITVYVGSYLVTSELVTEIPDGEDYEWSSRIFSKNWQVTAFKPLLGLENIWMDGDFSWQVRRAP